MKIYTKRGDEGFTSIFGGTPTSKTGDLINLGGGLDELNSFIGLLIGRLEGNPAEDVSLLKIIQGQLFVMGTCVTTTAEQRVKMKFPRDVDEQVTGRLEDRIDHLDAKLPELKNFILPGGGMKASLAHVCRTICRRIERQLVHTHINMTKENVVTSPMMAMVNRLSDYFFVLGRYLNFEANIKDDIWSTTGEKVS